MAAPTVADRHGMNHDLQFRGESLLGPCSMLTAHYESSSTGWKLRTFILNHSFSSTTFTLFYVTWIEFARNSIFSCNGETPHCRIVHGFLASALCIAQVTLSHRTNMLPTQIYNISSSQDFSADPSAPRVDAGHSWSLCVAKRDKTSFWHPSIPSTRKQCLLSVPSFRAEK